MPKEEPAQGSPGAAKLAPPASPPAETHEGWPAWRQPKVFIPLMVVFLMAVGIVVNVFVSKESERNRGDVFSTTVQQSQNTAAAATVNSTDEVRQRDVAQAPAPLSQPSRRVARAPEGAVPQQSVPPVARQPGVSIHVDHSPGAITAQNITANSIEVRTPN